MTTGTRPPDQRPAWAALEAHQKAVAPLQLRKLFADDPQRGERLALEAAGIYLDYSKNRITDATLGLLVQLAEESGLRERIDAMFRGEHINVSENRAVLHVALRAPRGSSFLVDGENVVPQIHARARQDERLRNPPAERRLERPQRQAYPQRRQYRHRGFGSRAGDGLRGAQTLQRTGHDVSLRIECRRYRLRRSRP